MGTWALENSSVAITSFVRSGHRPASPRSGMAGARSGDSAAGTAGCYVVDSHRNLVRLLACGWVGHAARHCMWCNGRACHHRHRWLGRILPAAGAASRPACRAALYCGEAADLCDVSREASTTLDPHPAGPGPQLRLPANCAGMFSGSDFVATLEDLGVTHVVWLPDSATGPWEMALESSQRLRLVRVCREGEAWPLAAGLHLGG